jgi:hypothetical protein
MRRLLGVIARLVAALVLLIVVVLFSARFADGPLGMLAGGRFKTGTPHVGAEPDWSFIQDVDTIEFQSVEPARSRTTWVVLHAGRVFIPCGYMDSALGRIWKRWPHEIEADGRVILRVGGKLYERSLVRIREDDALVAVLAELSRKYTGQPIPAEAVTSGSLWIFEVVPRS